MEFTMVEHGCCTFENVNNLDNVVDNNLKVNLTLELPWIRQHATESERPHASITENSCDVNASRVEITMKTESATKDDIAISNCTNPALIFTTTNSFSMGIFDEIVTSEATVGNSYSDNRIQTDYLFANARGYLNNELGVDVKSKNLQSKNLQSESIIDSYGNLHNAIEFSNTDHKNCEKIDRCNEHESVFHESSIGLPSDGYCNIQETSFSADIHLICENQGDFYSEQVALEKECCSSTASGLNVTQTCSSYVTGLQLQGDLIQETSKKQTNMTEEFHHEQYENTEFSNIFSSVDIYQRAFEHCYNTENSHILQQNIHNFVTDLESQPCEKSITDSGVFDFSISCTGSAELNEGVQYSHDVSSSGKLAINLSSEHNKSMFQPETLHSRPTVSNTVTNASSFSDRSTKLFNHLETDHRECISAVGQNKSAASTFTLNSAPLSFHHNLFDRSLLESSIYDPCLSDYNRNDQKCLYESPQDCTVTYPDWNSWENGCGTPCDIHSSFIYSKQQTDDKCSVSSTDTRGNLVKPEIIQVLKMQEDEEETDDADEIDYLPLSINTKNDHLSHQLGVESVGAIVYCSNSSCTGYSPSVLTPPPSASTTPVPSSSQDNCILNDADLHTPWSVSKYDTGHIFRPSVLKTQACKLKSQQLDTNLLSFRLSQGTKRPFPSMADVMRNSRTKSGSHKKCAETINPQPRRSGRPRKTQIQSDKISTTAMSNTQKNKSKYDIIVQNAVDPMNIHEVQAHAGESKKTGSIRHNEPLNQHAVEIMTQWFEQHIDNPYPVKADKENMAALGGITENQVKSWFANKRNRTNNTKPKVQKRAMEEKLKEIFRDLKRNHQNPMADNSHVIQQLSGIIQHCHSTKLD